MTAIPRTSPSITHSPTIHSTKNDSCGLTRTTKIALAIFAALAGFVFLPFKIAVALSFVITLGAIVFCSRDELYPTENQEIEKTPESRTAHLSSPLTRAHQPRPLPSPNMPTRIEILTAAQASVSDTVIVTFESAAALKRFELNSAMSFRPFATLARTEGENTTINICLTPHAKEQGESVATITTQLGQTFGRDVIQNIALRVD